MTRMAKIFIPNSYSDYAVTHKRNGHLKSDRTFQRKFDLNSWISTTPMQMPSKARGNTLTCNTYKSSKLSLSNGGCLSLLTTSEETAFSVVSLTSASQKRVIFIDRKLPAKRGSGSDFEQHKKTYHRPTLCGGYRRVYSPPRENEIRK